MVELRLEGVFLIVESSEVGRKSSEIGLKRIGGMMTDDEGGLEDLEFEVEFGFEQGELMVEFLDGFFGLIDSIVTQELEGDRFE